MRLPCANALVSLGTNAHYRLGAQADRRNAELGLSPQWQHEQLATLQRAMETAMGVATDGGVSSETESFSEVRGIPAAGLGVGATAVFGRG